MSVTLTLIGGTGIANIWSRDALATAAAARSLAEAFPRRTLIGLGVSHRGLVSNVRGHDYASPLATMASYLDAAHASVYTAVIGQQEPVYLFTPLRPKMLRLAAEQASGAHPYLVTPEHAARAREILGDDRILCPQQAVVLDAHPGRPRALACQYLAAYFSMPNYVNSFKAMGFTEDDLTNGGSNEMIDAFIVWGGAEAVVARVREHVAAGAKPCGAARRSTTTRRPAPPALARGATPRRVAHAGTGNRRDRLSGAGLAVVTSVLLQSLRRRAAAAGTSWLAYRRTGSSRHAVTTHPVVPRRTLIGRGSASR